jgi:MFS family permease
MTRATATSTPVAADLHAAYNRSKLFLISVIALATAGISFSMRASVASTLRAAFFDPINAAHSAEMIGAVLGVGSLGFALTIAIGSPMLDFLGMGRLLSLSSLCFIFGTLIVDFADKIGTGNSIYWVLWSGVLLMGVGWGLVETVINPLTAALYTHDKTARLNTLHAWWPGGLIIGGLAGLALDGMGASWQVKLGITLLPALTYLLLTIGTKFPPTERAASGIPAGQMFKEMLRPMFLVWFFSMFLTASSELAPGQWVDIALTRTVGMRGIWLLIYVSGLMFVMRHFAGKAAHKLSPVGLLWVSCLLASIGLLLLSVANSPITGLLAATVWGTGVCYMWPTMLASSNERFPRGGALLLGLMGTAGNLAIYFVLPQMGAIFDRTKVALAGGDAAFKALEARGGAELDAILGSAAQTSFRYVAILPAILLIVFGAIWLSDRAKGGYKPEQL